MIRQYLHKFLTDVIAWLAISLLLVFFYLLVYQNTDASLGQLAIAVGKQPWLAYLFIVGVLKIACIIWGRSYLQNWRYISFVDVERLVWLVGLLTIVATGISYFLFEDKILLSLPILDGVLTLVTALAIRMSRRFIWDRVEVQSAENAKRFLILGAGDAGTMLAREIQRQSDWGKVIGFLDDDTQKAHQIIAGSPVIGTMDDLATVLRRQHIDQVFITMPSAKSEKIRAVVTTVNSVNRALEHPVDCKIMPSVAEWLGGRVLVEKMRDVQVEDLLKRAPVQLDSSSIQNYLHNKVVLVTGAGGSIGSEIARQVMKFQPKQLLLLGRGEGSVYAIAREYHGVDTVQGVIADVRHKERLEQVFNHYKPEVVFHAAAHKHVPFMESYPAEAVLNNIIGTKNVVDSAIQHGVNFLVNISTDKAVNPTSVMGASKRIAEWLVEQAATKVPDKHFVSVRFGNVLGSRGSVIPLFKKQIAEGGPVTVTHPEMIRYFMTIPEAAQLVLQAGGLAQNGAVCVLDMGKPVKIVDLAKDLISLSGFAVDKDIEIVYSGMRPGEKLYEELFYDGEDQQAIHDKIYVSAADKHDNIDSLVSTLHQLALQGDEAGIRQNLQDAIQGATLTLIA